MLGVFRLRHISLGPATPAERLGMVVGPDRSSLLSPWPLARLQYTFALQHEHNRVPKQSPQLVRAKVANMRARGLPSALRSTYLSRCLRRRRPLGWRRGGGAPSACLRPRGRGRPPIDRPRSRPYDGRPGGLRTGSPPSPPPRSIRPTVRRLPRSPRLSGPGPHSGRSIAVPRHGGSTGCPAPGAEPVLFGGLRCRRRRAG